MDTRVVSVVDVLFAPVALEDFLFGEPVSLAFLHLSHMLSHIP